MNSAFRQTVTWLPALLLFLLFATKSTALSQAVPPQTSAQTNLHPRVIVFVHGIHGDRNSFRAANGAFWPDLIRTDPRFAYSDVEVAEYPSPASNGRMSSVQLADLLFTRLQKDHVWDHREVVFLAHSLGGILVEEMLLRHPAEAAKVRFIVSYGTPHEGSTVARLASIYDKDPLLNDLSDASSNSFLTQLEHNWRSHDTVNGIHRFCAYEAQDTVDDEGFIRFFKPHTRVVSYFSATYGCDVTTPPQEIQADHIHMVRPLSRSDAAYDFFRRVYRDNPVLDEQVVTRESIIGGLTATCTQPSQNADLLVPVALDPSFHERITSATATLINTVDVHDISPDPPAVTRIEASGLAHVTYSFKGPGRKLLVCLGNARASLRVTFTVSRQVPLREPQS